MRHHRVPDSATFVRTTPRFDADTIPVGLLSSHHLAARTWGVIRVDGGELEFTWEDDPDNPTIIGAGDSLVIPPEARHHVSPPGKVSFEIDFYSDRSGS